MTRYVNNATGESQFCPPPNFRGGILADAMGLGKTLTMLALIASDTLSHAGSSGIDRVETTCSPSSYPVVKTTLIVVPLSREWCLLCVLEQLLILCVSGKLWKYGKAR